MKFIYAEYNMYHHSVDVTTFDKMATYDIYMATHALCGCLTNSIVYNDALKGGDTVKIEIQVDENTPDMDILITCKKLTPKVEKILAMLRMIDHQITGKIGEETHLLDVAQIIYIESVERKCFIYTAEEVYESDFPLYELERQLSEYGFFRVSKSFLVHLQKIQSLRTEINRRICITMINGEQIIASRQYADELKKKLEVK